MSKSAVIGIVVVVVVLAGGGALLAKHNSDNNKNDTSTTPMNMNSTSSTSSSNDSAAPVATDSVTIKDFAFSPAGITVKKGTTVTWTNSDSTAHTVTETDGQTGPDSGNLAPGKTYTFTFNTTGTFKYHCAIHSEMTGTVTVTE